MVGELHPRQARNTQAGETVVSELDPRQALRGGAQKATPSPVSQMASV